jgi:hypothetical protein
MRVNSARSSMSADGPLTVRELTAAIATAAFGRVESKMSAVAWGHWPTLRFPSPLIQPDYRIRLSDVEHAQEYRRPERLAAGLPRCTPQYRSDTAVRHARRPVGSLPSTSVAPLRWWRPTQNHKRFIRRNIFPDGHSTPVRRRRPVLRERTGRSGPETGGTIPGVRTSRWYTTPRLRWGEVA